MKRTLIRSVNRQPQAVSMRSSACQGLGGPDRPSEVQLGYGRAGPNTEQRYSQ